MIVWTEECQLKARPAAIQPTHEILVVVKAVVRYCYFEAYKFTLVLLFIRLLLRYMNFEAYYNFKILNHAIFSSTYIFVQLGKYKYD